MWPFVRMLPNAALSPYVWISEYIYTCIVYEICFVRNEITTYMYITYYFYSNCLLMNYPEIFRHAIWYLVQNWLTHSIFKLVLMIGVYYIFCELVAELIWQDIPESTLMQSVRQQSTTWAIFYPVLCRHMPSLSHNNIRILRVILSVQNSHSHWYIFNEC